MMETIYLVAWVGGLSVLLVASLRARRIAHVRAPIRIRTTARFEIIDNEPE